MTFQASKIPFGIRLAIWLRKPVVSEDGRPKLDLPLWYITQTIYTFAALALIVIFAIILAKLLPELKTLRHFLIASIILVVLVRMTYFQSHLNDISNIFDISEFKWRHYLSTDDPFLHVRKPVAIFYLIWFGWFPALVALLTGFSLMISMTEWGLGKVF